VYFVAYTSFPIVPVDRELKTHGPEANNSAQTTNDFVQNLVYFGHRIKLVKRGSDFVIQENQIFIT